MSAEGGGGDPDSTRLLERVMDRLDKVLFQQGFEFRDDKTWEDASAEIQQWIFKFYDDLTGGDEDYDPNAPAYDSSSTLEVEGEVSSDETSASETLSESAEETPVKRPRK